MQKVLSQEQVKISKGSQPYTRLLRATLRQLQAFSFTVPALVLLSIFLIYPISYVVYLSFQHWNLLGSPQFIGLTNYRAILAPGSDFLQSVGVTIFFVILAVPTQIAVGLFLAILLENAFPLRTFFRGVFFIPMVLSFVAAGITFARIFSSGGNLGVIPQIFANLGISFPDWEHKNATWAMIIVVIMNTWKAAGFSMILYIAGLQSINPDYYEAASIDGARNSWQRFRYIQWPLLAPTTTLLVISNTIGSFRAFIPFYVMTNGGPNGSTTSIIYYIYNFFADQTGRATAAATLFLVGVLMITAVQLIVSRRIEAR